MINYVSYEYSFLFIFLLIGIPGIVGLFLKNKRIFNIIKSLKTGKPAGKNPWQACSLEWHTPTVPPEHGNFGEKLPVVHRWPYDFGVPGAKDDFIPQTTPPSEVIHTKVEKT